jgi:hypothetical protein
VVWNETKASRHIALVPLPAAASATSASSRSRSAALCDRPPDRPPSV